MKIRQKRFNIIVLITAIVLLMPLLAMQFTNEVNWNLFDFVIAGVLLLATGLTYDFVIRKVNKNKFRILIFVIIFLMVTLIWAELAVGIFGTLISGN